MKKIAIVTGASSGLGKEFALQIPKLIKIDEIWLLARRKERLNEIAAVIESDEQKSKENQNIPHARAIEMDLSGRAGIFRFSTLLQCEKALDAVSGGFEITVLINNAGFGTYGPFEKTPLQREIDMIDLNCTSLIGVCGAALPYLTSGSIIINTASLAAFFPLGNFAVYAASKAFVLNFSEALAAEVKEKKIKVCTLCPGPVDTEFAAIASNGAREKVLNGLPASKVAAHALKCAFKGKRNAIMTLKWKTAAFISRFIGRRFCAEFTFKHFKRPNANNK